MIKVPDGPLTSRLQKIRPGDQVIVKTKPTGTLVIDALLPGQRLWMISTGTGLAPFASLMRDPETYGRFEQVILTQTCRLNSELGYGQHLAARLPDDPLVGAATARKFLCYATTTREPSARMGRITDLVENGRVFADLGVPALNPDADRVMICGSMALNAGLKNLLELRGFREGAHNRPGSYLAERAFVG